MKILILLISLIFGIGAGAGIARLGSTVPSNETIAQMRLMKLSTTTDAESISVSSFSGDGYCVLTSKVPKYAVASTTLVFDCSSIFINPETKDVVGATLSTLSLPMWHLYGIESSSTPGIILVTIETNSNTKALVPSNIDSYLTLSAYKQ